jgi:hypothetical protein
MSETHKGENNPMKKIENRLKISNLMKGNKNSLGFKQTEEVKQKISKLYMGIGNPMYGKKSPQYIEDRSKLKIAFDRRTTACFEWSKNVKKRDNWKCKILNKDCEGRLESHHILDWENYPELRYDINNGITLCHAHHPRGRAKEKKLSPYFQELIKINQ